LLFVPLVFQQDTSTNIANATGQQVAPSADGSTHRVSVAQTLLTIALEGTPLGFGGINHIAEYVW